MAVGSSVGGASVSPAMYEAAERARAEGAPASEDAEEAESFRELLKLATEAGSSGKPQLQKGVADAILQLTEHAGFLAFVGAQPRKVNRPLLRMAELDFEEDHKTLGLVGGTEGDSSSSEGGGAAATASTRASPPPSVEGPALDALIAKIEVQVASLEALVNLSGLTGHQVAESLLDLKVIRRVFDLLKSSVRAHHLGKVAWAAPGDGGAQGSSGSGLDVLDEDDDSDDGEEGANAVGSGGEPSRRPTSKTPLEAKRNRARRRREDVIQLCGMLLSNLSGLAVQKQEELESGAAGGASATGAASEENLFYVEDLIRILPGMIEVYLSPPMCKRDVFFHVGMTLKNAATVSACRKLLGTADVLMRLGMQVAARCFSYMAGLLFWRSRVARAAKTEPLVLLLVDKICDL